MIDAVEDILLSEKKLYLYGLFKENKSYVFQIF